MINLPLENITYILKGKQDLFKNISGPFISSVKGTDPMMSQDEEDVKPAE